MRINTTADEIRFESEDNGLHLVIETEDGDTITVNFQHLVFEVDRAFMREVHSYVLEAEHARATYVPPVDPEDSGYAPDDPKSPGYYERMVGDN